MLARMRARSAVWLFRRSLGGTSECGDRDRHDDDNETAGRVRACTEAEMLFEVVFMCTYASAYAHKL